MISWRPAGRKSSSHLQIAAGLAAQIACLAALGTPVSCAANRLDSLSQYVHTRWALRDGFGLFPVQALAQTEDGYLWLGAPDGLWHFDGVRFVQWQARPGDPVLPSGDIRVLAPAERGGLWIGTAAGIRKLVAGRLTASPIEDENARGLRALLDDPATGLWAGRSAYQSGGLTRVHTAVVTSYGVADGLPDAGVNTIFRDRKGTLWLGTQRGLLRWPPDGSGPIPRDTAIEVSSISETADGQLVVASSLPGYVHRLANGHFESLVRPSDATPARVVLGDREGNVWIGTFSQGLARIRDGRLERFTRTAGLSGAVVESLLEDRDGGIWLGTHSGLDHFRPPTVAHLSAADGLSEDFVTAISASRDGGMWVATATAGIDRIDLTGTIHNSVVHGLHGSSVISLYEDTLGRLWAGTLNGLVVAGDKRPRQIRGSSGEKLDRVTVIAGDRHGRTWIADGRKGLYTIIDGVAKRLTADRLTDQTDIYALLADSEGRLWIGYHHGRIAVVGGAFTAIYDTRAGVAPGPVLSLYQDPSGAIWAGTGSGLSRYRNGRWTTWTAAHSLPAPPVHEIVADDRGGLWVNTRQGLARLDMAELARQPDGSPAPLRALVYGVSAGMRPQVNAMWAKPRSAKSLNGRLWFATEEGVAIVDPSRARASAMPAHMVIEQVKVDGVPAISTGAVANSLAFRGKEVQFDFTVVDLTSPDSARFRYRLVGFDGDWIEAQKRRQAYYSNLSPARYRFEVVGTSTEGAWIETSAALNITVLPVFYQTWLFRISTGLATCAVMFVLFRMRIGQIARQLEFGAEERLAERTRIARELHDTLLQTVVGISLQLDAFANRPPSALDAPRDDIRGVRRQLDEALREARHSVWALRVPELTDRNLVSAVQKLGQTLTAHCDIQADVTVEGRPYPLPAEMEHQLLRIALAAIANAVLHSHGSQIRIQLVYLPQTLTVRVADNGRGVDSELIEAGRPGHFGLRGMRERAERIGAKISIASQTGSGTSVEVTAPNRGISRLKSLLLRFRLAVRSGQSDSKKRKRNGPT